MAQFFRGNGNRNLRYAGFTILTDPNFLHSGDHVHLGYGLTSKRLTNPAIEIEKLPPIDFCLLSHYHGDHFDHIVEEKLDKNLPIISTKHAAKNLGNKGFKNAIALDTWEAINIEKGNSHLRITSMPGKHAPGPVQYLLPPVMGSMLDFFNHSQAEPLLHLYVTGDTLLFDDLKKIPEHFSNIDLALLHLGGTRILGLMLTMDARQGVEAIKIIKPKKVIPIHYNDYTVFKSPLEDFKKAVREAGFEDKIIYLEHGETYQFEIPESRLRGI